MNASAFSEKKPPLEVEKLYKQFAIAFILQLHSHIFSLHIQTYGSVNNASLNSPTPARLYFLISSCSTVNSQALTLYLGYLFPITSATIFLILSKR